MSEPTEMELVVGVDGGVKCIYDEALDLRALGKLQITRASHVEPDTEGMWFADMGPSEGPVLGPFGTRAEALQAERGWLGGGGGVAEFSVSLVTVTTDAGTPEQGRGDRHRRVSWVSLQIGVGTGEQVATLLSCSSTRGRRSRGLPTRASCQCRSLAARTSDFGPSTA